MDSGSGDYKTLAEEIAHCPVVEAIWASKEGCCAGVVNVQRDKSWPQEFQVPEPWSGHLETAPILFIASNPAISEEEWFPTWSWPIEETRSYFFDRFAGGPGRVENLHYPLAGTGEPASHSRDYVRFWAATRSIARTLLGPDAEPGTSYALTEVVHCKSRREEGVPQATKTCAERYLKRIVELAGARVLVVLGRPARLAVGTYLLGQPLDVGQVIWEEIAGRRRGVLSLPHPNARGKRRIEEVLSTEDLEAVRGHLVVP
jgi:hypothetical protein